MADRSQTSTCLSVYVSLMVSYGAYGGLHSALADPHSWLQTVVKPKLIQEESAPSVGLLRYYTLQFVTSQGHTL